MAPPQKLVLALRCSVGFVDGLGSVMQKKGLLKREKRLGVNR